MVKGIARCVSTTNKLVKAPQVHVVLRDLVMLFDDNSVVMVTKLGLECYNIRNQYKIMTNKIWLNLSIIYRI